MEELLKNIPTAKLVEELCSRENVELYECDHYGTRTKVTIIDENLSGVYKEIRPRYCDVLLVSREDKYPLAKFRRQKNDVK